MKRFSHDCWSSAKICDAFPTLINSNNDLNLSIYKFCAGADTGANPPADADVPLFPVFTTWRMKKKTNHNTEFFGHELHRFMDLKRLKQKMYKNNEIPWMFSFSTLIETFFLLMR